MAKKIAKLNEFAKTDLVKNAAADAEFVFMLKSDITGHDKDGNPILSKNADVTVLRKEDLAEAGYGEEGDGTDDQANAGVGESQWPPADEVKQHVQALDKCRGALMKGAGMADEDVYGDPAGVGEHNDMDEALKALDAGDLKKAAELRKSALAKRATRPTSGVSAAQVAEIVAKEVEKLAKALEGKVTGSTPVIMPRKGVEGEVIAKDGVTPAPEPNDLSAMAKSAREQIAAIEEEQKAFLAKAASKIPLTPQEVLRRDQTTKQKLELQSTLAVIYKRAKESGTTLTA